jgi:hypothetical protein
MKVRIPADRGNSYGSVGRYWAIIWRAEPPAGPVLRQHAACRERSFEHRLLERTGREAVASKLERDPVRRLNLDGHPSEGEDERVRRRRRHQLGGEDVPQLDRAAGGGGQLVVVQDPHACAVEALQVEVAAVLVDDLADGYRGDSQRHLLAGGGEYLGRVKSAWVTSPVGNDDAPALGDDAIKDLPRVEHGQALELELFGTVRPGSGGEYDRIGFEAVEILGAEPDLNAR